MGCCIIPYNGVDIVVYIAGNVAEYFAKGIVVYFGGRIIIYNWGNILSVAEIKVFACDMAFVCHRRNRLFLFCGSVWRGLRYVCIGGLTAHIFALLSVTKRYLFVTSRFGQKWTGTKMG